MIQHELGHIPQAQERDLGYIPSYLWGMIGTNHDTHAMEVDANLRAHLPPDWDGALPVGYKSPWLYYVSDH